MRMSGVLGPLVHQGDAATGVILMDRLRPARTLHTSSLVEPERVSVISTMIRKFQALDTSGMAEAATMLEGRNALVDRLEATCSTKVFLHGDLHHANVLLDGDEWIPIDPKGLVGDPAFECAAYLANPISDLPSREEFIEMNRQRIRQFAAELGFDPFRIWAWSMADFQTGEANRSPDSPWHMVHWAMEALEPEFNRPM